MTHLRVGEIVGRRGRHGLRDEHAQVAVRARGRRVVRPLVVAGRGRAQRGVRRGRGARRGRGSAGAPERAGRARVAVGHLQHAAARVNWKGGVGCDIMLWVVLKGGST